VKPEGDSEQKGGRREETKEHQKQDGFENHDEAVRVCVCVCVCVGGAVCFLLSFFCKKGRKANGRATLHSAAISLECSMLGVY
jgi:hypothetical protein